MADRPLKLRDLRRILIRYGCWEDSSRGKGSHTTFLRRMGTGIVNFPLPTHGSDVLGVPYVKACRRRFKLTAADGVSDAEFYGD